MDIYNQDSFNGSVDEKQSANDTDAWFIWDVTEEQPSDCVHQNNYLPLDYRFDWSLETEEMFHEYLQVYPGDDIHQILCINEEPCAWKCGVLTHEWAIVARVFKSKTEKIWMWRI